MYTCICIHKHVGLLLRLDHLSVWFRDTVACNSKHWLWNPSIVATSLYAIRIFQMSETSSLGQTPFYRSVSGKIKRGNFVKGPRAIHNSS